MRFDLSHVGKKKWRNLSGDTIVLEDFIRQYGTDRMIFVGTDSQGFAGDQVTKFVTAIVFYNIGKGGICAVSTERVKFINSLREKLMKEAWMSIETALYINEVIPVASIITIDLDVNSDLKWKSNKYKEELCGMVAAQGFDYSIKPDVAASRSVANKLSK